MSWAQGLEDSARKANEGMYKQALMDNQRRTTDTLKDIRDTLTRIEQLLLGSTSNGESSETKRHSI